MGSETLNFNFTYDQDTDKLGCLDVNGDFIPFNSGGGGIDTSDATAYAKNIEAGYTAYARGEKIVGIANVAHTFTRYTTSLSKGKNGAASASNSKYAIFGGGYTYIDQSTWAVTESNSIDAYNSSLTRSGATALSYAKWVLAATTVGDYVVFGTGRSGNNFPTLVDAYDNNLVRSQPVSLSDGKQNASATNVGDYAIFAGGDGLGGVKNSTCAFNSSFVKSTISILSQARTSLAATTIGNYALFAGGMINGSVSAIVDGYDDSLTRHSVTSLTQATTRFDGTSTMKYALFGGGQYTSYNHNVDCYDSLLVKGPTVLLSLDMNYHAATAIGNYALFAGGNSSATVEMFDSSLTKSNDLSLSQGGRYYLSATTFDDYALFAGGGPDTAPYSNVDAFYQS